MADGPTRASGCVMTMASGCNEGFWARDDEGFWVREMSGKAEPLDQGLVGAVGRRGLLQLRDVEDAEASAFDSIPLQAPGQPEPDPCQPEPARADRQSRESASSADVSERSRPAYTVAPSGEAVSPAECNDDEADAPAVYCHICQMYLSGLMQWQNHRIGRKHKKNQQRAASRPAYSQSSCSGGQPPYPRLTAEWDQASESSLRRTPSPFCLRSLLDAIPLLEGPELLTLGTAIRRELAERRTPLPR